MNLGSNAVQTNYSLRQRFPNCGSQKESWWVVKNYGNLEINYNFFILYV